MTIILTTKTNVPLQLVLNVIISHPLWNVLMDYEKIIYCVSDVVAASYLHYVLFRFGIQENLKEPFCDIVEDSEQEILWYNIEHKFSYNL